MQREFEIEIGSETEIGNQNTVSNYSCYFQKVFYFHRCCRVQRPILITNSDREKCPPCALWVSCDLVRRRALVNTCPLLLINMTRAQKWPHAFHLVLPRVEFLYMTAVSSYRDVVVIYSLQDIYTLLCCIIHFLDTFMYLQCTHWYLSLAEFITHLFSSFSSRTVRSTQQTNGMRRKCVTTWSEQPSIGITWRQPSSSRR